MDPVNISFSPEIINLESSRYLGELTWSERAEILGNADHQSQEYSSVANDVFNTFNNYSGNGIPDFYLAVANALMYWEKYDKSALEAQSQPILQEARSVALVKVEDK